MGAVGRMLRRELESDLGQLVDIDSRSGCDARGCAIPGTVERQLLCDASTVVLAVPESVALAILPALCDVLPDTALIVETLSVKARFARAIAVLQPPFEVIGINPMFAPSLGMAGRAVAVVPHLAGANAARFISLLVDRGAQVTELSAIAHDRTAAALQALPHAAILAFALAFADSQLDVEATLRLAPPPASALLALAARIAGGNPEVYYEIQNANRFAPAARDALARALQQVLQAGNDADTFARLLADVASEFGDSFPQLLSTADCVVRAQCPQTEPRSAAPAGRAATPQS
jgi:prephenate dehydrogenase